MPTTSPAVSVVVPIYKVERWLAQCVDSILAQTLREIEVILVDDGSPDACPALCDAYAARDSRVRVVHQENGGYGKAVNAGIAAATAPYIGIVEPDDFIIPSMYASLWAAAQEHGADVVKGWFYDFLDIPSGGHTRAFPFPNPPAENRPFRITDNPQLLYMHPSVWSCLYRREFLETNGIRMKEVPGAGWTDNPFQVQTLCLAERIVFINKPFYHWRRVNEEAADDLKDYRIPLDRCGEIRDWLNAHNIHHPDILANLYARELNYVLIISRMRHIADMSDCCSRIKALCSSMEKDILRRAPLNRKNRKAYRLCSISPRFFIFIRQLSLLLKRKR